MLGSIYDEGGQEAGAEDELITSEGAANSQVKVGLRVRWPWSANGISRTGIVYCMRVVDSYKHASVAFDDCTFGEWALGQEFEKAWGSKGSGVLLRFVRSPLTQIAPSLLWMLRVASCMLRGATTY